MVVALWVCPLDDARAAPITFNAALPVAAEEFVFRLQLKLSETEEEKASPRRQVPVNSMHPVVLLLSKW